MSEIAKGSQFELFGVVAELRFELVEPLGISPPDCLLFERVELIFPTLGGLFGPALVEVRVASAFVATLPRDSTATEVESLEDVARRNPPLPLQLSVFLIAPSCCIGDGQTSRRVELPKPKGQ